MLDLSKLQAGKWEGNWQSLDVNDLVRSQVSLMRGMAANFRIRLSTTLEENLPRFQADERAVKQILLNLLSNAIKFTQAEGTVSVTTRLSRNGEIELIISDTGCGMTRSEIEQALTPFKQVNNEAENSDERSQPNGTGLGLPIAKALAEANKMGFHIASEKGQGVRVHLLIET